jgi:hypothetical protein
MYNAKLIKYTPRQMMLIRIDGGGAADNSSSTIYVPSQKVLVEANGVRSEDVFDNEVLFNLPFHAYVGKEAQERYITLMKALRFREGERVRPEQIEVDKAFIEWASHLKKAQRPPGTVRGLLSLL